MNQIVSFEHLFKYQHNHFEKLNNFHLLNGIHSLVNRVVTHTLDTKKIQKGQDIYGSFEEVKTFHQLFSKVWFLGFVLLSWTIVNNLLWIFLLFRNKVNDKYRQCVQ